MDTNEITQAQEVQVNIRLNGKDAEEFLAYKESQAIKGNATLGYKLIIERLRQVKQQPEELAQAS